jgi:hypothetical protein
MLSPPALTGVIPAITVTFLTAEGSAYDKTGFMWLLQAEVTSMPLSSVLTRSSSKPWMAGRLETAPPE